MTLNSGTWQGQKHPSKSRGTGTGREVGQPASVFSELSEGQRDPIQMLLPPQRPLMKANTGFLQLRRWLDVVTCKAAGSSGPEVCSSVTSAHGRSVEQGCSCQFDCPSPSFMSPVPALSSLASQSFHHLRNWREGGAWRRA